jgi:hypothetical protein
MLMIVHLRIGVQWNPSCIKNPLQVHFVYPYERKDTIDYYA